MRKRCSNKVLIITFLFHLFERHPCRTIVTLHLWDHRLKDLRTVCVYHWSPVQFTSMHFILCLLFISKWFLVTLDIQHDRNRSSVMRTKHWVKLYVNKDGVFHKSKKTQNKVCKKNVQVHSVNNFQKALLLFSCSLSNPEFIRSQMAAAEKIQNI